MEALSQVGLALNSSFSSANYAAALEASGKLSEFERVPTYSTARGLALAIFDALHRSAPADARFALMSSAGKDSSAVVALYLESVQARVEAGLPFVPATILFANTGHEFPTMAARQRAECDALNRFGDQYGIRAEIVTPPARDTVMAELLGSGLALPPRATNDKIQAAGVANWCVSRVKSGPLDIAVERASRLAPIVFQALGTRFDESGARAAKMKRYAEGFDIGLTSIGGASDHVIGVTPIAHFTDAHIRDFVHNEIAVHRFESNLELEQIYTMASSPGLAAGECAIRQTQDGTLAAGCGGLASATRTGCCCCLKAVNRALENLATVDPKRHALLWRLQQEIYQHHDLHTKGRLFAARSLGFTPDTLFPKGFTFRERYRWLVFLLAAEMVSGDEHLTAEQKDWIERRWRRHGVFTVDVTDAQRDAHTWVDSGAVGEPGVWFDRLDGYAADFTEALGEAIPLGAIGARQDEGFVDLNYAHLLGLGITGTPVVPVLLAYVFRDRNNRDELLIMVTDTPSILGAPTNTGLLNGQVGVRFECVGTRSASSWEEAMSRGRHFFYRLSLADSHRRLDAYAPHFGQARAEWSLDECVKNGVSAQTLAAIEAGFAITFLATLDTLAAGLDREPLHEQYRRQLAMRELRQLDREGLCAALRIVTDLAGTTEYLQGRAQRTYKDILNDLRGALGSDWSPLESGNEKGRQLRRAVNRRLDEEVFDDAGCEAFSAYIDQLRRLLILFRAGTMNAALAHQLAYVARTWAVYPPDGQELFDSVQRALGWGVDDQPFVTVEEAYREAGAWF